MFDPSSSSSSSLPPSSESKSALLKRIEEKVKDQHKMAKVLATLAQLKFNISNEPTSPDQYSLETLGDLSPEWWQKDFKDQLKDSVLFDLVWQAVKNKEKLPASTAPATDHFVTREEFTQAVQSFRLTSTNHQEIGKIMIESPHYLLDPSLGGRTAQILSQQPQFTVDRWQTGEGEKASIQANCSALLQALCAHNRYYEFSDTSSSNYLHNPTAKFDLLLQVLSEIRPSPGKSSPLWSRVATFGEIKSNLGSKTDLEEVVGQLQQRVAHLFAQQTNREEVLCFAIGKDQICFFLFSRPNGLTTTGVLPFGGNSVGMALLQGLLQCPPAFLGYRSVMKLENLPQLQIDIPTSNFRFELMRPSLNARSSLILRCAVDLSPPTAPSTTLQYILKLSPTPSGEAEILKALSRNPFVPVVLSTSLCYVTCPPSSTAMTDSLALGPVGRHLTDEMPLKVIARVFHDVALCLKLAAEQQYLHRDVSPTNIVQVTERTSLGGKVYEQGQGLLIDWHVAIRMQELPIHADPICTGTGLFTSMVPGPHTLSHDLESLFYSVVHVATGGQLPWRHAANLQAMAGTKMFFLFQSWDKKRLRISEPIFPLVDQLHKLITNGPLPRSYLTHPISVDAFCSICHQFF